MKSLFTVVSVLIGLTGCASIEGVLSKNTLAAQLIIQEATARTIEVGKTPAEQQARAQKISITVAAIKQSFDTTATTLPDLVKLATDRVIALKLGPADALIAQALLDALAQEVQVKVCTGTATGTPCIIAANKTVWVDEALGWVSSTAALYKG